MTTHGSLLANIEKLESDLWEAADNLRANSKLTSSEYCMPVLGIIFLRHAANRFEAATRQIAEDQATGKMPKRQIIAADYVKRRARFLPEEARYESILATPTTADLADFSETITSITDQLRNLFTQNQKLRTARDLLLPKLMSGKIDV